MISEEKITKKQIISVSVFLFSLIAVYFNKIILYTAWLWEDFPAFYFPIKYNMLNDLKEGIFTFWNPYVLSGIPIAADIQLAIFYPLTLPLIIFSKPDIGYMYWLMEIQVIFHLFLGGLFMYFLMRHLKASHFGSLFSAMIFSLLPMIIVHLKHINITEGFIWMPLIFLFFHKALHNKNIKYSILAGFFMGISILAGHMQVNYLISLFLIAYLFYFYFTEKTFTQPHQSAYSHIIKYTVLTLPVFLVSFGVAAIEIIPYMELNSLSMRATFNSFFFSSSYSLSPVYFLFTSILPHFFGGQSDITPYWNEWNYWELTSYAGISVLFLLLIGFLFLKNQKIIKFLLIVCALSLLMSFGYYFFFYPIAYYLLPGLKLFRVPARFLLLYGFSLTIISGFALDFITDKKNLEKIKLFFEKYKDIFNKLPSILFLFFAVIVFAFSLIPQEIVKLPKELLLLNIVKDLLVFFVLSFFLARITKNYLKNLLSLGNFKIAILLLAIADIFLFGFEFNNGRINPENIFKNNKETQYLATQKTNSYRVIADDTLIPNAPLVYKFPDIKGQVGAALTLRYSEFTGKETNTFFSGYNDSNLTDSPNRLKLLNVCYVFGNKNGFNDKQNYVNVAGTNLYKTPFCSEHSYIVHSAEIEKNPEKILAKIDKQDFDPLEKIILEKQPNIILSPQNDQNFSDTTEMTKYEPNYIEIKTSSTENGILFLSENYYPGWEAYIDGAKTEIYQANYIFRAIALQEGNHIIKFIYNPKIFKIGAIISLVSLISTIAGLLYLSILERKNHKKIK